MLQGVFRLVVGEEELGIVQHLEEGVPVVEPSTASPQVLALAGGRM